MTAAFKYWKGLIWKRGSCSEAPEDGSHMEVARICMRKSFFHSRRLPAGASCGPECFSRRFGITWPTSTWRDAVGRQVPTGWWARGPLGCHLHMKFYDSRTFIPGFLSLETDMHSHPHTENARGTTGDTSQSPRFTFTLQFRRGSRN